MNLNLPTLAELERERAGKPLAKPSKVARMEKKADDKAEQSKARAKAEKADRARLAAIREAVFKRDQSRCRGCGVSTYLTHASALYLGHVHHVIYRSRQGSSALSNLCVLCARCHEAEHQGKLEISGDPNATLRFRELVGESGKAGRTWESSCPR